MKDIYKKLETLQAECAVTRTSRLTHSIISKYGVKRPYHGARYHIKDDNLLIRGWHQDVYILYIYVSILIWRPDAQTEILKLCADCTKSDVALNNLVIRARPISWLKHTTYVYMWLPPTQSLHLPCHSRRRQIKAPAAAKAKSSAKPSKPGQVSTPKKAKPAKAKRSAKPTTKEE